MEEYFWNIGAFIECGWLAVGIITNNTNAVVCACTFLLMWQNWWYHGKK